MKPLSYRSIYSAAVYTQNKQLINRHFDDIYHHQEALAESQEVFLEGNRLYQRWHDNPDTPGFVIAETGFGSGLNFLTCRRLWHNCQRKPAHLHFISTEQWLLTTAQFNRAYQDFSELHSDISCLAPVFKQRRAGFHRHRIDQNVTLHLLLGDTAACLQQLKAQVDAWFLDGFSPAKNPDMWSQSVCAEMARLSQPGTTVATFTAASQVRKNLQAVGFEMTKTPGFKGKRERLIGRFKAPPGAIKPKQPWAPTPRAKPRPKRITIIGGGIAGLCLAFTAKEYGLQVTLIDRADKPMSGASGNPYALMMPYLTAQPSPEALFYWRAFEAALGFYSPTVFTELAVQSTQQLPNRDARRSLPKDLIQATEQGLRYPTAGFVDTTALAEALSPSVDEWLTAEVAHIKQNRQGQWLVQDRHQNTVRCCDVLVVATGAQSMRLIPSLQAFMTVRRGQTECYHLPEWPPEFNQINLNQQYVIPVEKQQQVLIGGDYHHLNPHDGLSIDNLTSHDPQLNLNNWRQHNDSRALSRARLISSRVGLRAGTVDHLPVCGPLVDSAQFKKAYADLHHGRHWQSYQPAQVYKNLYLLTGLGARGFTSAPLLARMLMAMVMGQPLPLERDLVKIVHPNRFLYRQLKKPPNQEPGDKL